MKRPRTLLLLLFAGAFSSVAQAQANGASVVRTWAGTDFTFQSEGQPAINAPIGRPQDVNVDGQGGILFTDEFSRAFRIGTDGAVHLLAGNGFYGAPIDGAEAVRTPLFPVRSIARGPDGSIYLGVAQFIKKILPDGSLAPVAGGGNQLGDGGKATSAELGDYVLGMVFDHAGNLFFADARKNRIRRIDSNGIITTIAGNGDGSSSGDGGAATKASFIFPRGLRFGSGGNLYISDSAGKIRNLTADGNISTFATDMSNPAGLDVDAAGNVYVAEIGGARVTRIGPDGKTKTILATAGEGAFNGFGLKLDAGGNVLFADTLNGLVRKVTPDGRSVSTVAGNGKAGFSGDALRQKGG